MIPVAGREFGTLLKLSEHEAGCGPCQKPLWQQQGAVLDQQCKIYLTFSANKPKKNGMDILMCSNFTN